MADKVVLAYSGGLDTSVAIRWIEEHYGLEVVTLTADLGMEKDFASVKQRALDTGATKALVADARQTFIEDYVFPALKAGAIYEGRYPLATALSRPLITRLLVDTAHKEGAAAVAHGCTGKGNDQVRFDVATAALDPSLEVIAPARECGMTRDQSIEYARMHSIPVSVTPRSPYSIDENLWGKSIECGVLEDPWVEPPEEIYTWTKSPAEAPDDPACIEVGFERGIPRSLNGEEIDGVLLVSHLNDVAGNHGVGRVDHLENRLVGIKSREIYEAPAAIVLHGAHQALEAMTLSKDQFRFKQKVSAEYADLVYNGLWFSALRHDLAAYVESTQRFVSGVVRLKLHKGNCIVVGRKSPHSLYSFGLATYDKGDVFDQSASPGFIHVWGLPARTQAQAQGEMGEARKK
ncbi:argininosuccinate synthase [Chloroflexota bacterium]